MAPKERFSISMDPELRAAVKEHARAMGLDVTRYVTVAVQRQMEEDDLITRRFAAVDADIAVTEALPAPEGAEVQFTEEELAAARAGMAQSLAAAAQEAA